MPPLCQRNCKFGHPSPHPQEPTKFYPSVVCLPMTCSKPQNSGNPLPLPYESRQKTNSANVEGAGAGVQMRCFWKSKNTDAETLHNFQEHILLGPQAPCSPALNSYYLELFLYFSKGPKHKDLQGSGAPLKAWRKSLCLRLSLYLSRSVKKKLKDNSRSSARKTNEQTNALSRTRKTKQDDKEAATASTRSTKKHRR